MMLTEFIDEHYIPARGRLSKDYVKRLHYEVGRLSTWLGRPAEIEDLTNRNVRRFLAEMPEELAAATINTTRGSLVVLWRAAAEEELVAPPGRIPKVPQPQRMPEAWTISELARLISFASSLSGDVGQIPRCQWWPSLILAIYSTGARINSLLNVQKEDCKLEDGYLILRAASHKSNVDRYKSLSDQTVKALAATWDVKRLLVWPWPYHRRYLWHYFRRRIVEKAGLRASYRGMSLFHKIRRSSLSYAANIDGDLARQQADHRDFATTARYYIDPRIAQGRQAANKLPMIPWVRLR